MKKSIVIEETEGESIKSEISLSKFPKHEVNPFVEDAVTKVQKVTVKKARKVGANKSAQHIIVSSETGEFEGYAQFMRIVEVDEEQFAKIYISEFGAFYNLNKAAMKVFHYIISNLKRNNDTFLFRMDKCLEFTGYKNKGSVFNALTNLVENGIIARAMYNEEYFINPLIMFNGDRIAYTKAYIKKRRKKKTPIF
jgi:hypothetical protein